MAASTVAEKPEANRGARPWEAGRISKIDGRIAPTFADGVDRSAARDRPWHWRIRPNEYWADPDEELVAEIEAVIAELPTYGYRRVHAILKWRALATGRKAPD